MATRIVNARIESTMLGIEDHGITTFQLMLVWGASGQGYGGLFLGSEGKPRATFGFAVRRVLETLGIDHWENLPRRLVRIEIDDALNSQILRLGHILEDRWLDLPAELKELEQ